MGDDGWCPRERTLVGLLVAALLVLSGGPAAAQQQTTESDIQNFKPIAGPNGIVTVEGTDPLGHLQLGGGLYLDYVNEPVVEGVNDNQTAVVDTQVVADALVGIGLFDIGQLDIHVPLYFANQGQFGAADFGGVAVGNIAVSAKGRILDGESFPVGLGLQLDTYIPTDPDSPFISDDKAGAAATVLVDKRIGRTYLGGNLGFRFRPNGNLRNLEFGDTFTVYKFRSMVTDAEDGTGAKLSEEDRGGVDPRVTRTGRFLRRTHLDEIPQLWSILVGDMSVVG
ncbi:MAG: sugar transferase, partial [Bradymonadaceae bacterium]